MRHTNFSSGLREERLLGQNVPGSPEAAAPAPEATPQIKNASDVIDLSAAKQQRAGTEAKEVTDKVAEANKNPMLKDVIGNVGDAALGKIEGFLKGTSAAAHSARMETKSGSDQEKAATGVRDLTDSGARTTANMREGLKGWVKGEKPADAPKAEEKKPVEVAKAAEKKPETKVSTLKGSVNAPEAVKNKIAAVKNIEAKDQPQTEFDKIGKEMDGSLQQLADAKTPGEVFAALGELLAQVTRMITRALDGSLFEDIKQPESKEKTPDQLAERKPGDARNRVTDELKNREKIGAKEPLPKEIEDLRKEKADKISSNEKSIDNATVRIDKAKRDNERLVDEEGVIKKEINALKGNEDPVDVQKRELLEADLKRVEAQIKANDELITLADKQRDKLTDENKRLKEEVQELDKMSPDIEAVAKKIAELTETIAALLKGKNIPAKSIELGIQADGPAVTIKGAGEQLGATVKNNPAAEVKDQDITISGAGLLNALSQIAIALMS